MTPVHDPAPAPKTLRDGGRIKLFAFPYAGGTAAVFRTWQQQLPAAIELRAAELPGHGVRMAQPLIHDYAELVQRLADEFAEDLQRARHSAPRLPYAVFGHSMGASLAMSVAAALVRRGLGAPTRCFLCAASHFAVPKRLRSDLTDEALVQELRQMGGTPEAIFREPDLLRIFLPILRADFQVLEQTVQQTGLRLPAPLSLIAASEDDIAVEDVWGWERYTTATAHRTLLAGHHFSPMQHPGPLLAQIRRELEADLLRLAQEAA